MTASLPIAETTPPQSPKPRILDWSADALTRWLAEHGQQRFRSKQIRKWLFEGRAKSFDDMTDLPKSLRSLLAENFDLFSTKVVAHQKSRDGTEKLLVSLAAGGEVECVLLRDGHRRSICVSSQVGCAMGCVFCASGLEGVDRNLTSGEILEQMLRLQHCLEPEQRLSHIVMMGMGEPLANLPNVLVALDAARADDGLGISPRRITISTVGLPPAIKRLAENGVPYNLAVSLHAPNDELRSQLVPVNQKIGIDRILEAADHYFDQSGRRLTFEYVLLGGINDGEAEARQLASRLRRRAVMLNVIPYNPVAGLPYRTPAESAIRKFRSILEQAGVNLQIRERKGDEIDAACGQLRRNRTTP